MTNRNSNNAVHSWDPLHAALVLCACAAAAAVLVLGLLCK